MDEQGMADAIREVWAPIGADVELPHFDRQARAADVRFRARVEGTRPHPESKIGTDVPPPLSAGVGSSATLDAPWGRDEVMKVFGRVDNEQMQQHDVAELN